MTNVYYNQGMYEKTLVSYQNSLDIKIRVSDYGLDVIKTYNNMGLVYQKQDQYEKDLVEYHKNLDIKIQVLDYKVSMVVYDHLLVPRPIIT